MNRGVFVYLELLKWMVRGCEPHLAQVYGGTEKICLVQQLGRGICPGSVLDCGCWIKVTVKFTI